MFRAAPELLEQIEAAAKSEGMTASEYVRSSVIQTLTWGWVEATGQVQIEQAPRGQRHRGMRIVMPPGVCVHPPTAIEHLTFESRCGLCGKVVKRRG